MVEGFAAAPSLTRANALGQYLFVNGRPVRDKLILGAVRAAYSDYLPRDRHPVVALFVTLDPQEVDANVHPAKTEVRFRNAGLVRALIVHALKDGLAREGKRTAANTDGAAMSAFRPSFAPRAGQLGLARSPAYPGRGRPSPSSKAPPARRHLPNRGQAAFDVGAPTADVRFEQAGPADLLDRPLGAARTQIHETYIVSQTRDVRHRRGPARRRMSGIVYEKLKASLAKERCCSGRSSDSGDRRAGQATVERARDACRRTGVFGLAIESFGPGAVAVRDAVAARQDRTRLACCAISPSIWRNGTRRCRWNAA